MVVLRAFVDLQHETADDPAVLADAVSDAVMDAAPDRLPGDDFAILLAAAVAIAEFLHRAVFECALVVENELFAVVIGEKRQCDLCYMRVFLSAMISVNSHMICI